MGCWAAPQLTKALLRVLPWKMTCILRGRPLPTTLIDLQSRVPQKMVRLPQ
jgi:hypothetical protein